MLERARERERERGRERERDRDRERELEVSIYHSRRTIGMQDYILLVCMTD